jgi:hypothetical protein
MSLLIPRHFHRIWLGSRIPVEFEQFGRSWLKQNPDWEMTLWTEDNLPRLRNQDLYDRAPELVASRLVWRFRSNLARYEILYEHGGVYLDTDFEALRPLEPFIDGLDLFAAEEKPGLIANGFMGSRAGHPFLEALISGAERSVAERPNLPSWRTTGPEYLTRVANERPDEMFLIPTHLVYPYHHTELGPDRTPGPINPEAFAHHVWASRRKSVSVVIPWRPGCEYREASRDWLVERIEQKHPDWQIVEADHPGDYWSKAEATIEGVRRSYGDIIVVHDADVWSDGTIEAVEQVKNGAPWAMPHGRVVRLDERASEDYRAGKDDRLVKGRTSERPYQGIIGGGIVVVPRQTAEQVPPDIRFRGWGGEDESWGYALDTLAGPVWRGGHDLIHLWHPPQERRTRAHGSQANTELAAQYRAARGNRAYMISLISGGEIDAKAIFRHERTGRTIQVDIGSNQFNQLCADPRWKVAVPPIRRQRAV